MSVLQKSFPRHFRALVFGAQGGIGAALVDALSARCEVYPISRRDTANMQFADICDGASLAQLAATLDRTGPFHLIINATGLLHEAASDIHPERSIKHVEAASMARLFEVNAIGPALVMRYFLPLLARDDKAVMAHLSARIGSISDNRIGGWTGYRAAKAAQNMIVKNAAIETARRDRKKIIVGLHPGTVDTPLSAPFQNNVPAEKLFTPAQSAAYLLTVIDDLTPDNSGHVFAWDGAQIPA